MFFRQYYLACLSHASYLIGDEATGRAVVVDPQRDVEQYLADADEAGLRIERVIETHFHADFLSGHLELARATGAAISFGPGAKADFPIDPLAHGQYLDLGGVVLEVRHTPGHTPESTSIVVYEHRGDDVPYGVLTGDTLFIGDVGRPDLLGSIGYEATDLARMLYRSLHEQLMTLPDATRVFPAHGAGSACGKNLSTDTVSTIGEQRRANYAVQPMSEDDFVAAVVQGQAAAPQYFVYDAITNRKVHTLLDEHSLPTPMGFDEVRAAQAAGALVLDTRDDVAFAAGHLEGSVNVGLGGRFAEYSGGIVPPDRPIVLVCDEGTELEAKVRLARIGFDRVVGALADPMRAFLDHPEAVSPASRLTVDDFERALADVPGLQVVDVRNPGEVALGMVPGATLVQLAQLTARLGELDPSRPTVVYCAGGYRSSTAASTLRANGFADVSDLLGGFSAWAGAGRPFVRPDGIPVGAGGACIPDVLAGTGPKA